MKTTINNSFYKLLVILLFPFTTSAQKLPNVQEKSLRAPMDIKVDGKPTEWNNQFQAYNKATEIFYTISNDNNNLYLTVQATDLDIANKIISAGITFTINGSGKMKDKDGVAVTFPFLNKFNFPLNAPPIRYGQEPAVMNEELSKQAKDIHVKGIAGITDTMISIYNPAGIKATALFDESKIFSYETAIPLKSLGTDITSLNPIAYNIKLNGNLIQPNESFNINYVIAAQHLRSVLKSGITELYFEGDKPIMKGPTVDRIITLVSPTDFWGEYTLAK